MEGLRNTSLLLLIVAMLHQTQTLTALSAQKMLHIPEKIIGGVIDIVQSHKNKPSQQSSFQQSVQTQTSFSQQGNPQGSVPQQSWSGPSYQGAGFQGQAQFTAQGQYANGYGNYGSGGNYQTSPSAPVSGPVPTGTPSYPVNPGLYQPQQGFTQSQTQGQYQNYPQNQGQFQNQNQQINFQGQLGLVQSQGQNPNGQYPPGQYGNGNYQGTGQFVGQSSGHYQVGQASGGNYQGPNIGQTTGGNYQNTQSGQYQGNFNGQYNQQGGQYVSQSTNQNHQSGYYPGGSQQTVSQTGQSQGVGQGGGSSSGSYGGSQSGGFQVSSSQQSGGSGPTCVCQAWTKPLEPHPPQVLHDELPKLEKIEKKTDAKPIA